jgi:hypothetical protein
VKSAVVLFPLGGGEIGERLSVSQPAIAQVVHEAVLQPALLSHCAGSPFSWRTPQPRRTVRRLAATRRRRRPYFDDCNEAGSNAPGTRTGVASSALHSDGTQR